MSFDPYHTWLGIPPDEQPADHYRLLGLRRFESNVEAISNAIDQRMAHLKSVQSGGHAEASQALLNEVAAAGRSLLRPATREAYDQRLRQSTTQEPAKPSDESTAQASAVIPTVIEARPSWKSGASHARRRKTPPATKAWAVWTVAGGSLAVVLATVLVWLGGRNQSSDLRVAADIGDKGPRNGAPGSPASSPAALDGASAGTAADTPPPGGLDPTGTAAELAAAELVNRSELLPPQTKQTALPSDGPFGVRLKPGDGIPLVDTATLVDIRSPFTCELWLLPSDATSPQLVLGNFDLTQAAGWQLLLMRTPAAEDLELAVSTTRGFSGGAVAAHQWRHVAVSSDGTTMRLFVDGKPTGSKPVKLLASSFRPTRLDLHIGAHPYLQPQQPNGFSGAIRGLRITRACLYSEAFPPPLTLPSTADTTLALDFQRPAQGLIADRSDSRRQGRLHGAAWIGVPPLLPASPTPAAPLSGEDPGAMPALTATADPPRPATIDEAAGSAAPSAVPPASAAAASPSGSTTPADVDPRSPMPDPPSLAAAEAEVQSTFAAELQAARRDANTASEKLLALAAKLQTLSRETQAPAERLALLLTAKELALEAAGLPAALPLIDAMETLFRVDGSKWRVEGLKRAAAEAATLPQRLEFVDLALQVAQRAAKAEEFELALEAARMAQGQASRSGQPELRRRALDARAALEQARKRQDMAFKASRRLEAAAEKGEPGRADDHAGWGGYLCLVRDDWEAGLPHLAQGDDEDLASAASTDLAAATARQRLASADLWWQAASRLDDTNTAEAMRQRAAHHYRRAAPELTGLELIRANQRIQESTPAAAANADVLFERAMQQGPPRGAAPQELACLFGALAVDGRPRMFIGYENGMRFSNATLRDALQASKLPADGRVALVLQGAFVLQQPQTVLLRQRGGSLAGGQLTLSLDGKQLGTIGGERPTEEVYRLSLARGTHQLQWRVKGGDLGKCQLLAATAAGDPLLLMHSAGAEERIRNGAPLPTLRMSR